MNDRFEETVRQAALGLGATSEPPTYHDAWRRGRRRRFVKRSALAAAGAMVFVAALTVNLGRLPGSQPTDSDDVAVAVAAATPTVLATTGPVDVPTLGPADFPEIGATPSAAPDLDPTAVPTSPPTTPTPASSADSVTPAPATTAAATPVPTSVVPPTPRPTVATAEPTRPPQPLALPETTVVPDTSLGTPLALGTTPPPDSADQPAVIAAAGIAQRPDAVVIGEQGAARGRACDSNLDGEVDATCELLADYSCSGEGDVAPGYVAFDDDGDGIVESCRAIGLTTCDTTGDGFGDTPCIIGLAPSDGEPAEPPTDE